MARKSLFFLFLAGLFFSLISPAIALEKAKLSSPVKVDATFYLPVLAAEERGFWKENGLEVEWVPFGGATPQMQAVAAGAINFGMVPSIVLMTTAERGVPVVIVAEWVPNDPFIIWVKTDSPYRNPLDLKGKRIAVTGMGAPTHAYGRLIVKANGIEKDVRFIGAGGVPQQIAGLKVDSFEGMVMPLAPVVGLKVEGAIRELASAADYLPKPWLEHVVFVRKDYARSQPEVVKKLLRAMLQAADFIRKEPRWAMDKMKSFQGFSEEAAKLLYERKRFTTTGRIDRKAVENVRRLCIEYGLLTEKAPAVDDLFTNEYLPG